MEYTHTDRGQLKTKIYQKLGETDTGGTFWPTLELDKLIDQALLTFESVSSFRKKEVQTFTQENKRLYDIFTDLNVGPEFIIPSLTYQNIIDWLNIDLVEDISTVNPTSEFFSLSAFLKAIETKYNLYQQLTNLVNDSIIIVVPAGNNKVELPNYLLDIVRVTFTNQELEEIILDQTDEADLSWFGPEKVDQVADPQFYTNIYDSANILSLYPIPANTGILKIVFIGGRDNTVPADENTIINLPNNLVPYLKYGIEADIFGKDGLISDPARVQYCMQRWQEGIMIGRNYTSALLVKANGILINIDTINNIDLFFDGIKRLIPPRVLGFGGFNKFLTEITPSANVSSISLLINANAVLPTQDTDFIQVSLEYIDMLADYVVHLASFKAGATQLASTNNLKDKFLKTSLDHNQRLQNRGISFETLTGITKKQEKEQPRIPVDR